MCANLCELVACVEHSLYVRHFWARHIAQLHYSPQWDSIVELGIILLSPLENEVTEAQKV